ncbi:MAG: putative DNA binding domain-containing protein [Candidatus Yanofskybacteria bacterium]|nr:putative DNA binding domain-containing protein [Candidatus Yanofskybacteria bacterium]
MQRALLFRKSPIVIVRNFIALQFASAGLYVFAGSLVYYARIWRAQPLLGAVPFELAQVVFIFCAEAALVLYIFFSWHRQTVRISGNQLVCDQGILVRSHTTVPFSRIATVVFTQSILGRLARYGTIVVRDSQGALLVRLMNMPEPQELVDVLTERKMVHTNEDAEPLRLVAEAEHERLERKSTLRWDLRARAVNKTLERAALKTVAAFMNTRGGDLLLGIDDQGGAVGMQHDISTLARKDADGLENHFSNLLAAMIGPSFRQFVRVKPFTYQEKLCMLVSVAPADRPAYVRDQETEEFFIRTGNGTASLKMSEANAYIATRFSA